MGGFFQWVNDPSVNPTWGDNTGSWYPESGQNILGNQGGLSSDWWGFPGGQWGPGGFSIPWYAPTPSQSDPWWDTPLGQSLYEMVFGIPYGMGGGNVQDLPAPPADVTTPLPGEETAPPVEDPSLPGYSDEPGSPGMPENPIPIEGTIPGPVDPTIPIAVGAGVGGAIIGGVGAGGAASPPITVANPEDPFILEPITGTTTPLPEGQQSPPVVTGPITPITSGNPFALDPVPIASGNPFALDPVPISSDIPGTLDPGTTSGTTVHTPSIPDFSSLPVDGGGGGPIAAPVYAHAGAPKNLTSLMQLPASVVQQIPRLGALLAGLR